MKMDQRVEGLDEIASSAKASATQGDKKDFFAQGVAATP